MRRTCPALVAAIVLWACLLHAGQRDTPRGPAEMAAYQVQTLERAIRDLMQTFGPRYPNGAEYLARLEAIGPRIGLAEGLAELETLRREALLANPLLGFDRLLVVKRKPTAVKPGATMDRYSVAIGMPTNHQCNSALRRTDWDNELAFFSPRRPEKLKTLYRPQGRFYVGETELRPEADRLLFTQSDNENWKIWEIGVDASGLRQVSRMPADVDCMDPCYLPDGRIVFAATASYQSVPCWHGQQYACHLYSMQADGSHARQLCFDQDYDLHPTMLPNGQVLYNRWDYTGINHVFLRQTMVMNPDGTGQRAIYGSNSWFPNSLFFSRPLTDESNRLISILSGYHGAGRMGQLVVLDVARGWKEAEGMVRRISGRGDPVRPLVRDGLVDADWPKFLHPFPLSDKNFLVAAWPNEQSAWGIYLADVFDNLLLLREEPGYALLEPVPLLKSPSPPQLPGQAKPDETEATVYIHDIYSGAGLAGVPRGTIKSVRLLAYNFGYRGLAGPDLIGYGGPWEPTWIMGTAEVEADGSAMFRVPARTPVAVQALDAEGKAVQLMRSWFSAQGGEFVSCVGCHERPADVPNATRAAALNRAAQSLKPWRGPPRGFDFRREVQVVLDRHCVSCHDGGQAQPDLRRCELVDKYQPPEQSRLATMRLHPEVKDRTRGIVSFSPAYDALIHYVRRVGIEDDVGLLVPGEYHADVSPLFQILRRGHHGIQLDGEDWDRLATWIDMNGPFRGRWSDVAPIPQAGHEKRMDYRRQFGGSPIDFEIPYDLTPVKVAPVSPRPLARAETPRVTAWPLDAGDAARRQRALGRGEETIDLGQGVSLKLKRVPGGDFVIGDAGGEPDEQPPTQVTIPRAFWIGQCEVTNAQFRRFDASHAPGYWGKRHATRGFPFPEGDDSGVPLDADEQPAVRVSWKQASEFCRWLSDRTGRPFSLPTEAQWEYACRAGSAAPLHFGAVEADFSKWANLADAGFAVPLTGEPIQRTGQLDNLLLDGAKLAQSRFNDGACVTARVGRYGPNAWGLYDMHGNAAEWTLSLYRSYPYREDDGRNDPAAEGRRVIRGGSFYDPPQRCRSAVRTSLPNWQRPFNTGFRVVCLD